MRAARLASQSDAQVLGAPVRTPVRVPQGRPRVRVPQTRAHAWVRQAGAHAWMPPARAHAWMLQARAHAWVLQARGQPRVLRARGQAWVLQDARAGCCRHVEFRAAFVAGYRSSVVDRAALIARLQVQRRGTLIAVPCTSYIAMIAEQAQARRYLRHLDGLIQQHQSQQAADSRIPACSPTTDEQVRQTLDSPNPSSRCRCAAML